MKKSIIASCKLRGLHCTHKVKSKHHKTKMCRGMGKYKDHNTLVAEHDGMYLTLPYLTLT